MFVGQAYIYSKTAGTDSWSLTGTLVSPQGRASAFGQAVAISGNYSVVSDARDHGKDQSTWGSFLRSPRTNSTNPSLSLCSHTAVYIFERLGGAWTLSASLTSPRDNAATGLSPLFGRNQTHFGHALSIDGAFCAVGAYTQGD